MIKKVFHIIVFSLNFLSFFNNKLLEEIPYIVKVLISNSFNIFFGFLPLSKYHSLNTIFGYFFNVDSPFIQFV